MVPDDLDEAAVAWRPVPVRPGPPLVVARTGSGPAPVVLIHGLGTHHRSFNALARNLRHPDGALALDLRGRGGTPATFGRSGLRVHAADVIRAMDAAGVRRTVLAGHSMGAYVALEVALRHPDRVAGVVLIDGGHPAPRPLDWLSPQTWIDAASAGVLMTSASSRMMRRVAGPEDHAAWWAGIAGEETPSADTRDMARYDLRRVRAGWELRTDHPTVARDAWLLGLEAPTRRELAEITCPVVLVRAGTGLRPGTPAMVRPHHAAILRKALRSFTDVVIPEANHYTVILGRNAARLAQTIDGLAATVLDGPSRGGGVKI